MTPEEIAALLAHKAEIDRRNAETLNMGSYERWTADAIEALLKTIEQKAVAAETPATERKP